MADVLPESVTGALLQYGWRSFFADQITTPLQDGWDVGRVVQMRRTNLEVQFAAAVAVVELPHYARWSQQLTVGDWIVVRPEKTQLYLDTVLKRFNGLRRKAAGEGVAEQWLAANLDHALVMMACDDFFSVNRLERFLSLADDGQVPVSVVLTKADLADDPDGYVRSVPDYAASIVSTYLINAKDPAAVAEIARLAGPGTTLALIGGSGAGKSTLINTLSGAQRMATGRVRSGDGKGRHTTSFRQLVMLPGGAMLIDTPGVREIQLPGTEEESVDSAEAAEGIFDDIEALQLGCRFRDCGHVSEPGCAVVAALQEGELSARRWENYCKMRDERRAHRAALDDGQRNKRASKRPPRNTG